MADIKHPISHYITDNTLKTWYALDKSMLEAHRAHENEYAESTARILLANADLPLLLRCRACMILGCSNDSGFLDMAKEAVRIAEIGCDMWEEPNKDSEELLKRAEYVLTEAQRAFDEIMADEDDQQDDGRDENAEIVKEEEGELMGKEEGNRRAG